MKKIISLVSEELTRQGYTLVKFPDLPHFLPSLIEERKWNEVDAILGELVHPQGFLSQFLSNFTTFSHIEYLISVRGLDPSEEEDGIWHDDGSRHLAFSLSLTLDPAAPLSPLEGGNLCFRQKGQREFHLIPTPPYGTMILFLTGTSGYEHRILKVEKGLRVMAVGWCSHLT